MGNLRVVVERGRGGDMSRVGHTYLTEIMRVLTFMFSPSPLKLQFIFKVIPPFYLTPKEILNLKITKLTFVYLTF